MDMTTIRYDKCYEVAYFWWATEVKNKTVH